MRRRRGACSDTPGARKTTSHSTSTKPRSWWWIFRRQKDLHITEDLKWVCSHKCSAEEGTITPLFLRCLRKFGMSPHILHSFYPCTVESILTGCFTAWYGNSTSSNCKALQRVVRTARHTVGGEFPSFQDIYTRQCMRTARKIISDTQSPKPFSLLPSGRHLRSIRSRTSRLRDSFFPQTIRLLNTQN